MESAKSPDLNCHLRFLGRTYRTLPEVIGDLRTTPLHDEDSGEDIWCRRICPNLPFNNVMTPYKRTKWKMFRTLSTIYEWYMEYWSLFYKVHGIHTVLQMYSFLVLKNIHNPKGYGKNFKFYGLHVIKEVSRYF